MRVMDRVVLGSHDGVDVPIHRIVDVRCPYGGEEDQSDVAKVMARNERHDPNVRRCLRDAIQRVEGDGCPRRQGFGPVVDVVRQVDVLVQEFVGVQGAVDPVYADLDASEVQHHARDVRRPATDLLDREVRSRVSLFDQPFVEDRQHGVHEHGTLGESDLLPHDFRRRPFPVLEDLLRLRMHEDEVVKDGGSAVVHHQRTDKVPQVAQQVVPPFNAKSIHDAAGHLRAEQEGVNVSIEVAAWLSQRIAMKYGIVNGGVPRPVGGCVLIFGKLSHAFDPMRSREWNCGCPRSDSA
mmetsp:Transcript_22629/g.64078  ORF Transcript_22629/g.64078 Transcript_22629/m.64078 type:complete len:294 (+) Transcript_22629:235-1116(+)